MPISRRFAVVSLTALLVTASMAADAQVVYVCSLGPIADYRPFYDAPATDDAVSIASDVAQAICQGYCGVDLFRNPTAGNAVTFAAATGRARVIYAPQFLQTVSSAHGDAAIFGILAHEVGHVLDARNPSVPPWIDSSWSRELRADAWAGCALAQKGLPANTLNGVLSVIAAYPSPTHPPWQMRIPAVRRGYAGCGGNPQDIH